MEKNKIMENITAIHHSEERYASLTLVAHSQKQRELIKKVIEQEITLNDEITISDSEVDGIFETTIEFHDDYDKKSERIFNNILSKLNIPECN